MRLLFAALASVALIAAAPVNRAPASLSAVATPQGGFRLGRATAPVQLVEYASLWCAHCREFHQEGWAALKRNYIAKGLVAIEVRNMVLNGADIVATLLARCDGPTVYFRRADVLYDQQPSWEAPYGQLSQAQLGKLAKLSPAQQFAALGRFGHLDIFSAKLGMTPAHYNACLADKAGPARLDSIEKVANDQGVKGTPTFFLNGRQLQTNSWAGVEAELRSALKK